MVCLAKQISIPDCKNMLGLLGITEQRIHQIVSSSYMADMAAKIKECLFKPENASPNHVYQIRVEVHNIYSSIHMN